MADFLGDIAISALRYGPVGLRCMVVQALATRNRDLAATIIPVAFRDLVPDVRLAALEAIAARLTWHDPNSVSQVLRDSQADVRAAAAHVMGQFRSVRVGRHLQAALRDPDPSVRAAAAWALGQIPVLDFSSALEAALLDDVSEVRARAAQALERVGRAEALVSLRVMAARDTVYENRNIAHRAIEGVERRTAAREEKKRQAMTELKNRLLDSDLPWQERERVKSCLVRIGDESLIPILDKALQETNDTQLHLQIVQVLAVLPPSKRLQTVLIECLHHVSPPVRRRAMTALGRIGDKEAIFYLDQVALRKEPHGFLLDSEDVRLARNAVDDIERRAKHGYPIQ